MYIILSIKFHPLILPILFIIVSFIFILFSINLVYKILHNPFHFPYFIHTFDVSAKRNVDITDYIDRFLCDNKNWRLLIKHKEKIENWKYNTEIYLQTCKLKKRRTKQYNHILDDDGAFIFRTIRKQTRYKQKNYIKTPYIVSIPNSEVAVNWIWLKNRYAQLKEINFEATLKDYFSKKQRKLMTKSLREQIAKRDNYTCQICGKYMPDEVGLQIDHIIPISKGGKTIPSNLQVLCSKCNGKKSASISQ